MNSNKIFYQIVKNGIFLFFFIFWLHCLITKRPSNLENYYFINIVNVKSLLYAKVIFILQSLIK